MMNKKTTLFVTIFPRLHIIPSVLHVQRNSWVRVFQACGHPVNSFREQSCYFSFSAIFVSANKNHTGYKSGQWYHAATNKKVNIDRFCCYEKRKDDIIRLREHGTHLTEYVVPVLGSSIRPLSILYGRQKPSSPFSISSLNYANDIAGNTIHYYTGDSRGITWTIFRQSAPHSRQITTPTPHHLGRMLFLMPNQQRQSTDGHV